MLESIVGRDFLPRGSGEYTIKSFRMLSARFSEIYALLATGWS